MAQLGTLTAGVAHELNNPAAAGKRGADQLAEMASSIADAYRGLAETGPSHEQLASIKSAVEEACSRDSFDGDAMTRSDLEFEFEGWLRSAGRNGCLERRTRPRGCWRGYGTA